MAHGIISKQKLNGLAEQDDTDGRADAQRKDKGQIFLYILQAQRLDKAIVYFQDNRHGAAANAGDDVGHPDDRAEYHKLNHFHSVTLPDFLLRFPGAWRLIPPLVPPGAPRAPAGRGTACGSDG